MVQRPPEWVWCGGYPDMRRKVGENVEKRVEMRVVEEKDGMALHKKYSNGDMRER